MSDDAPRSAPHGWLELLARSDAEIAAGKTVPAGPLLDDLKARAERIRAARREAGARQTVEVAQRR